MKRCLSICILLTLTFLFTALPVHGMTLQISETQLSLSVESGFLRDVMLLFSHAGVRVRMDPTINTVVTVKVIDQDLDSVFEDLLIPYGYVLIWDVVEGPLGEITRLAEIQIFKPGQEEAMVPLYDPNTNLEITRGSGPAFVKDEVLLAVKKGTSLASFQQLLAQIGGTVIDCAPDLGVYRVRFMPGANVPALVAQLTDNNMVHTVEPNYVIEIPPSQSHGANGEALLSSVSLSPDSPIRLAILDSGLGGLDALNAMVVGRLDAVNPERELTDPLGHGTQMALIGSGMISPEGSMASDSGLPIVAIRAFDDNGAASQFGIMRSIEYALGQNARVLNMSWGSEVNSSFLATAVAYAQSKGLLLVAAAGNEPSGTSLYPAALPGVIAVAATAGGTRWDQSNYGDFVSLAAPGEAQFPIGYNGPPGLYAGTSISSAYVSRALALYLAAHPKASNGEAVKALQTALTDAGAKGRDPLYGYGVLDAQALARFLAPSSTP